MLKERCNQISVELDALYDEKKMIEVKELLDAITRSSKTRSEVSAFLEN